MCEMEFLVIFIVLTFRIDNSVGDHCSYQATSYITKETVCENLLEEFLGVTCTTLEAVRRTRYRCCQGWTGHNCNTPRCTGACLNGGACDRPNHCDCLAGYTDKYCETPVCSSYCQNGGQCIHPNQCKCASSFTGESCQTPVCERDCQNKGKCIQPNTCSCPLGSSGRYCEENICKPDCTNGGGGDCTRPNHCQCPSGFIGKICEIPRQQNDLSYGAIAAISTSTQQNDLSDGAIAAISTSVVTVVVLVLLAVLIVVCWRKGHMKPFRRGLRAMSVKYRNSVSRKQTSKVDQGQQKKQPDAESIYMYEEIDTNGIQKWQLERHMISLESLLKPATFADIYLATLKTSNTTVVAKTLKADHTEQDGLLMKAKINFNAVEVGQHENILKFIGAVVDGSDIGPFMIYEYCSNGQMPDYLETMRSQVTLETVECLGRFALGVTRGMSYLAERKIIHRRLAARNILLDSNLEPKVTGFGPRTENNIEDGGNAHKKERIPLKWTAPECHKSTVNANEKSDMWSFGIVLWEIFSLGDSPYSEIKGKELSARLKGGYRLPKPEYSEDKWYGVMTRAWFEDSRKRPTFKEIRHELDEMFVSAPVEDYYYCTE